MISLQKKVQQSAKKPIPVARKAAKCSKKGRNRTYFTLATFAG